MLRRNLRQVPEQLPRILPAAGLGLIEEPTIDNNVH